MSEQEQLEHMQKGAQVILDYWRSPRGFSALHDAIFMLICTRTYGEGADYAELMVHEMATELKRSVSQVSPAVNHLLYEGLIERHKGTASSFRQLYRVVPEAVHKRARLQ